MDINNVRVVHALEVMRKLCLQFFETIQRMHGVLILEVDNVALGCCRAVQDVVEWHSNAIGVGLYVTNWVIGFLVTI